MPGGRVPSRLLITSRCGGWFAQKGKETRAQRGYHCRLGGWGEEGVCALGAGTRTPLATLFSPHFPGPNSPRWTEMKILRGFLYLFPPAPAPLVRRRLVASPVLAGSHPTACTRTPGPGLSLRNERLAPVLLSLWLSSPCHSPNSTQFWSSCPEAALDSSSSLPLTLDLSSSLSQQCLKLPTAS